MQSLIQQFLAFCRSKPADEEYDYLSNTHCAVSQFLRDKGYAAQPSCSAWGWRDEAKGEHIGAHPPIVSDEQVLALFPRTFGALTARLEAALAVPA